jgi:serine/threonine-protein phosphatase PGAM5
MAVRWIYLVRHGHYEAWKNSVVKGEGHITSFGKRQAMSMTKCISALPLSSVFCSSLNRAVETCKLIIDGTNGVEMRTSTLLQEVMPVIPARWEPLLQNSSSQNLVVDRDRAELSYSRHFASAVGKDKHDLIVAHGNLIRYFVCRALDVDVRSWGYMDIDHCSLTVIRISSNGWTQLVRLNDTCHLPDGLVGSKPEGGLADTLRSSAMEALEQGDVENARHLGQDALGFYINLDSKKTLELQRWLAQLPI